MLIKVWCASTTGCDPPQIIPAIAPCCGNKIIVIIIIIIIIIIIMIIIIVLIILIIVIIIARILLLTINSTAPHELLTIQLLFPPAFYQDVETLQYHKK